MADENDKVICGLCGKEFKDVKRGLKAHLKQMHDLSIEEYEAQIAKDILEKSIEEEKPEKKEKVVVTQQEIKEHIFGKSDTMQDKPLSEFLIKYNIEEKDLVTLINSFKKSNKLPDTLINKNKMSVASDEVKTLKDKEFVETTRLEIADILTKEYDFVCEEVKRAIFGKRAKTWVLKKRMVK